MLRDRNGPSLEVEPGVTCGDYLSACLQGTRNALYENNRESITITIDRLDARSVGALIALYERAVGLYALLINVNAYHQPGVEAGKNMAGAVIKLQQDALSLVRSNPGRSFTVEELATAIKAEEQPEALFKLLEHASMNEDHRVKRLPGKTLFDARYQSAER